MKRLLVTLAVGTSFLISGCRETETGRGEEQQVHDNVKPGGGDTTGAAQDQNIQQDTGAGASADVDLDTSFAPGEDDFDAGKQDTAGYVE